MINGPLYLKKKKIQARIYLLFQISSSELISMNDIYIYVFFKPNTWEFS